MAVARYLLLGCLILVIAGCGSSKPKDLIIGKWKGKDKKEGKDVEGTIEFTSDGKAKFSMGGKALDGKYKFVDDNHFELEMTLGDKSMTKKVKIDSITKEKMVTSDSDGKVEFTRIN